MSRSIEGRHDGRKILLPVTIIQPEPATDLTGINGVALLDTGATTSGVARRIARQLQLVPLGKRPVGLVRGEVQIERYPFRVDLRTKGSELAFPFVFEQVTGLELADNFTCDALIGMDILSQCDFNMERGGRWSLAFG